MTKTNKTDEIDRPGTTKAIIYCRIASGTQTSNSILLAMQEERCRAFAERHGYRVDRIIEDVEFPGTTIDRPGITTLLDALGSQPDGQSVVVVVDDISRLARDIAHLFELKTAIEHAGGKLESVSQNLDDSPESQLLEHMMLSAAEHAESRERRHQDRHPPRSRRRDR